MSATDNKLLKQCKLKFQNCYELNGGTVNVKVFVEKFMQNIRLGGCSLRLIGQLSGQFLLLSVFAEGIGACLGIVHGETLGEVLPYYLLAFLSLYLYFSISGLIDVQGKQEALKTTVMDFLENRMTGRIVSAKKDSEYLDEVEKRAREEAEGLQEFKGPAAKTEDAALLFTEPAGEQESETGEAAGREDDKTAAYGEKEALGSAVGASEGRKAEKEELEELLGEFLA